MKQSFTQAIVQKKKSMFRMSYRANYQITNKAIRTNIINVAIRIYKYKGSLSSTTFPIIPKKSATISKTLLMNDGQDTLSCSYLMVPFAFYQNSLKF
jgi:hypothetical protein